MENHKYHRFLDEAGDTTFYGKHRVSIVGQKGVSNVFILGMVAFQAPLDEIRTAIRGLQLEIGTSKYYQKVPSVVKRVQSGGFYFHAKNIRLNRFSQWPII